MLVTIKSSLFSLSKHIFGNKFTRSLHRVYKKWITKTLKSDLEIIEKVSEFIHQGDLVLDIGANIGQWTVPLSKKVGQQGSVISFEPNQETISILRLKTKRLKNLRIVPFGLSDKEESVEMLIPEEISCPPNATIAQTASHIDKQSNMKVTKIRVKKLHSVVSELDLKDISFIKIDVEGHESNVLRGFSTEIEKNYPLIFMEILKSKWIDESPKKSESAIFLIERGYHMLQYSSNSKEFEQDKKFNKDDLNFLFTHPNRI